MPLAKMQHAVDPKQQIQAQFQEVIKEVSITGISVLIAIYKRPVKTQSGIMLPDQYRDEDLYQGKAGLILAMGPYPFSVDDQKYFGERLPKVGDWVMCRPSDGMPFTLGSREGNCRLFKNRRDIHMVISEPDLVW